MIPKGGGEQQPLKFLLFAIITPSSGHENIFTLCKGANLSKIFPQDLSTSTKSFGFPFDRGFESENVLKDLENYKIVQVDSIMESGEDEYSDSLWSSCYTNIFTAENFKKLVCFYIFF